MKRGKAGCPSVTEKINKPNPGQVTHRVIREWKRVRINKDGKPTDNYMVYWVIHWSSAPTPGLEKRRIYQRKDGSIRTDQAVYWTLDDLKWLADNQDEIIAALRE